MAIAAASAHSPALNCVHQQLASGPQKQLRGFFFCQSVPLKACLPFRASPTLTSRHRQTTPQCSLSQPLCLTGEYALYLTDSELSNLPEALIFDCDGVLVDTERDGHRVSFNQAFQQKGLNVEWGITTYGELLKIGGGKERMTHFFNQVGWPPEATTEEDRKKFVAELHKIKTELFMQLVESGTLPLRPGVARLVDEALFHGVKVAVCSTSNEKAVTAIVTELLGEERAEEMTIFAGDIVPKKKPNPAIYNLAATTLNVNPARCVVVEDSHNGLTAAKAAGMNCIITKSGYTEGEDFAAADEVYDDLGETPYAGGVSISTFCHMLTEKVDSSSSGSAAPAATHAATATA